MRLKSVLLAAIVAVFSPLTAKAGFFTGDPVADGWTQLGNSLAAGTYVQGVAGFSFDLYTSTATLASAQFGWQSGDTVIGAGGVFVGSNPNLTTSGNPPGQLPSSTSARLILKLGTSASTFEAASPGPARGSFSGGHGGNGSLLFGIDPYTAYAGGAGTPTNPSLFQRYTGSVQTITGAGQYAQLNYTWDTLTNKLSSFEYLVNTSALARAGYTLLPQPGNEFIMTVQRDRGDVTDAIGQTAAATSAVPLPGTLFLFASGGLSMAGCGVFRRRKVQAENA